MWLNRYAGQSSSSPAPPATRSSSRLSIKPQLTPRTSSLTFLAAPLSATPPPPNNDASSLRRQLGEASESHDENPVLVLESILSSKDAPLEAAHDSTSKGDSNHVEDEDDDDVDFSGLSLSRFVHDTGSLQEYEAEAARFHELHTSISGCDQVLGSVEAYLTSFRADLAAVSAEIESLQHRSSQLDHKLSRRKQAEQLLEPEVAALAIPPNVVRKLTEGPFDEAWVKALDDLERISRNVQGKPDIGDLGPLIQNLKDKVVERIRDHVVAQIKAIRAPGSNAQLVQQKSLLRFRRAFAFLASQQPQLGREIAQAYINTMRWYYVHSFTRYKLSLDKLVLHNIDKTEVLGQDESAKKTTTRQNASHDAFSLGRRTEMLHAKHRNALTSHVAEEDKSSHYIEVPFRAFNLALVDNASAEFYFLTSFFPKTSFQAVNRQFSQIFEPTFELGRTFTKQLVESSADAIGALICVRLNQHSMFELQRRKVASMESHINGISMLLWPRFQMIMDAHCESLRKATASLPGRPAGSARSLTSTMSAPTVAPHSVTQRFANFAQAILTLSRDAGDDEPTQISLGRLRNDFDAFLTKLSKSFAEPKKRERFLINNLSLVGTIISGSEGHMAEDLKQHFEQRIEEVRGGG